ncbi:hypothetical protein ABIG06_002539 [Bradyrhizobium sp. USDA 326]
MDQTAEECTGGNHNRTCAQLPAISQAKTCDPPFGHDQLVSLAFDDRKAPGLPDRGLHGSRIKLPVSLGSRATNSGALPPIENTKLDATGVAHATHQAIQGIDLSDEMTLAETTNGRIAGHRADRRETVRHQNGRRPHPRSSGRGLTAGVTAANHNDVETLSLCSHSRTSIPERKKPEVETRGGSVSRETTRRRLILLLRKKPHTQ